MSCQSNNNYWMYSGQTLPGTQVTAGGNVINTPQGPVGSESPLQQDDSLSAMVQLRGYDPTLLINPDSVKYVQKISSFGKYLRVIVQFCLCDDREYSGYATVLSENIQRAYIYINNQQKTLIRSSNIPLASFDARVYFFNGSYVDYYITDRNNNFTQFFDNSRNTEVTLDNSSTINFFNLLKADALFMQDLNNLGYTTGSVLTQESTVRYIDWKLRIKFDRENYAMLSEYGTKSYQSYPYYSQISILNNFKSKIQQKLPNTNSWIVNNFI